jgi:hypothetical protein
MQVVYLSSDPGNTGKKQGHEPGKERKPTLRALSSKLLLRVIGA